MADKTVEELEEEIGKLTAKNNELIGEIRKAKGGLSAEESARIAGDLDAAKAENIKLANALKKATDSQAAIAKESETKLAEKSAKIQKMLRDEGLVKGLIEAGVKNPAHLKATAAMLRDVVEVDEDKGEAFATVNGIRRPLGEFIKGWAESDEGKAFIEAPVNSGAGASGGVGKAPAGGMMKRDAFEQLTPDAQREFIKGGGKPTD
jgi:hypothetical protein